MFGLDSDRRTTGSPSLSFLSTRGRSASSGRRPTTRSTAFLTSFAAASMSRPESKVRTVRIRPRSDSVAIEVTPLTPASAPSITEATWLSTTSGAAPV